MLRLAWNDLQHMNQLSKLCSVQAYISLFNPMPSHPSHMTHRSLHNQQCCNPTFLSRVTLLSLLPFSLDTTAPRGDLDFLDVVVGSSWWNNIGLIWQLNLHEQQHFVMNLIQQLAFMGFSFWVLAVQVSSKKVCWCFCKVFE